MKKRSISLLLCLVMVFSLLPFSAMATVFPVGDQTSMLEIKFFKGDTEINSQRAAKDSVSLYDPGCPVEGQEVFRGWKIAGQNEMLPVNATEEGGDSIAAYVKQNYDHITSPLRVNAVLTHVRYLVYMDENDRVLKTDYALEENGYEATVNLDYVPTAANKDFFGWATTKNADEADYQNGAELTLNADKVTLYPVCKAGYWLSFDNNLTKDDTRATFAAPEFYVEGQNTHAPTNPPERSGYEVEGWYTDKDLTNAYDFGTPLKSDLTLYAKWRATGTVKYRVNFWRQSTSDAVGLPDDQKTYEYFAPISVEREAQAGSTVSITQNDKNRASNMTDNIVKGTNEDWRFFEYNAANSNTSDVVVKGDGTTVLNVYYDRKTVTFNFYGSNGDYYIDEYEDLSNGAGGGYYYYDDPYATGYWLIGYQDGPYKTLDVPEGTMVYSYDDMRKDNLNDSSYNGNYFYFSVKNPDANNVYSSTDSKFTKYNGTLYHNHNYWFASRQFAQFRYYENQTGTYKVGTGPDPTAGAAAVEIPGATHYKVYPSGYYLVGDPSGPLGDWTPQNGGTVYMQENPSWTNWNSPSSYNHYYASGDFRSYSYDPTDYSSYSGDLWNYGPLDPYNQNQGWHYNFRWKNGELFGYMRWKDRVSLFSSDEHKYRPVYYYYDNGLNANITQVGYYEKGQGPDPTAPATHRHNVSSYTGLYGAEFKDWPKVPSGKIFTDGNYDYPIPISSFVNSSSSSQTVDYTLKTDEGSRSIKIINVGQTIAGGDAYEVIASGTARYGDGMSWYPEEQYIGFTCDGYRRGNSGSWTPYSIPASGVGEPISVSGSVNYDLYIHYARNQHHFIMSSNNQNVVDDTVYYEAPLTKYGLADYVPSQGPAGTYFDGWYADPGCTIPFNFNTTMPDSDVVVYAKWTDMRFRVILDPTGNNPSIANEIRFPGNQVTSFRLDYGEKIEKNAIQAATRDGYQLVGWYSDPNFEHPFSFDTADWTSIADFEYAGAKDSDRQGVDIWNGSENWNDVGEEYEDVVGKVMIYAKWRHVMDENEYLTVSYDAAPGTIATSDTNHYADMASAIALPAPQAPAGFTFSYWQVLGTDGQPTGVNVTPGHTYDVRLADADENKVVHLKAVYAKSSTATHITWVGNGGTTEAGDAVVTTDTESYLPTNIISNETFTRENAEFLGWARLEESKMWDAENETWKNPADVPEVGELDADDLFLIWNESEGKYYVNHNVDSSLSEYTDVAVTQIAADEIQPYHVLYAVWQKIPTVNYVVDYNAKMKLAENATIADDPVKVENNGKFTGGNGNTVYYQFDQLTSEKKLSNGGISLAFNGIDSARITGKFYDNTTPATENKAAAATEETKNVNMVPASSVYFDDDLVNATVTVGDGSGYNDNVSATPASAELGKNTYTYTFTGTGIDIYCTTFDKSGEQTVGYAQAKIDDGSTPETKVKTIRSQSDKTRYNVPTFSFRDLTPGEHTLTLFVYNTSHYKLDGIRVYNSVQNQELYKDTTDQYAVYVRMRDALINNGQVEGSVEIPEADKADAKSGVLFVDNRDHMKLTKTVTKIVDGEEVICYEEDGKTPKTVQVYADNFEAYKANSPKTEIYLDHAYDAVAAQGDTPAQDAKPGQSITFTLTSNAVNGTKLWIGLSAPDYDAEGGTVAVTVNNETYPIDVKNAADMYYPLDLKGATGATNVTIQNTGSTMISVTQLKVTGNKSLYEAANAPAGSGTDGTESTASVASFTDVMDMVFEPVTMMTVKLAANNGVDPDAVVVPDDPGTPDNPDTPDTPDNPNPFDPMAMLKALFEQLLKNLFNLFSGLGNW